MFEFSIPTPYCLTIRWRTGAATRFKEIKVSLRIKLNLGVDLMRPYSIRGAGIREQASHSEGWLRDRRG